MRSLIAMLALLVAGCGGGGGLPVDDSAPLAYVSAVASPHSYTPHKSWSHLSVWNRGDVTEVYIGGDLAPREALRHVATTEDGIRYFMGASRDGVGVARLENYKTDLETKNGADRYGFAGDGFFPFIINPNIVLDSDLHAPGNEAILNAVWDSVRILNDALPPEFQIEVFNPLPGYVHSPGEIFVHLESPDSFAWRCGQGAVACAINNIDRRLRYTSSAEIYLPNDFDTSDYTYTRSTIVHELLHALGVWGHVDSVEFPDSIMGSHGGYIPNLGNIISRIDREVLQIMYMSQRTDLYNDWGEWSDTTHHLVGRSEDEALNFGVALFNGLPQPWAHGTLPETFLADNRSLSGTATWDGNLLGYSGSAPIAGDAQLQVRLSTLASPDAEQDLRFRDIYFLNRFESQGPERWFYTRNIDYKVNVVANAFFNVDGEGYVLGAFLGAKHEHMGGTVKRTDMVAAFGGSR